MSQGSGGGCPCTSHTSVSAPTAPHTHRTLPSDITLHAPSPQVEGGGLLLGLHLERQHVVFQQSLQRHVSILSLCDVLDHHFALPRRCTANPGGLFRAFNVGRFLLKLNLNARKTVLSVTSPQMDQESPSAELERRFFFRHSSSQPPLKALSGSARAGSRGWSICIQQCQLSPVV